MNKIYELEENTFRQYIKESTSYSDFFKKAKIGRGPNATNNLLRRCEELDISLDHFHNRSISKIDTISDDEFINLANQATSYSNLLNLIGIQYNCTLLKKVRNRCDILNINFSTRQYVNSNKTKPLSEILVENSTYNNTVALKNRLLKAGLLENKCYICENNGTWLNQKLSLQLDHINGNHYDNRLENLRLLCPNCHSQTETYCSKRGTKSDK